METLPAEKPMEVRLQEHFAPFEAQAQKWTRKAKLIVVTDATQTELMAGAKEARIALKKIRNEVDNKHKELKADALLYSQTLDKIRRTLVGLIEPIEEHLQEQENFIKVQEQKAKDKLIQDRTALLKGYITDLLFISSLPLGEMSVEAFDNMLYGYKAAKEQRVRDEEQKKNEEIRKNQEAEAERNRLATEAQELRKKNEETEKKLKAEREAKKKLEDQAEAKRLAEEAKKKQEVADKRKAARAPDKVKLASLIELMKEQQFAIPKMATEDGQQIANDIQTMYGKMIAYATKKISEL